MATPYALTILDRTTSTQDDARLLFDARRRVDDRPALVVAAFQTAGRGRSGSDWENAPRGVAASLALRPSWPAETWPRLSLVAGLAAHQTLGADTRLKWPNDVLVDGRKLAGLLVEASGELAVVGIGVNLWWPDAPPGHGARHDDDPGPEESQRTAERWAEELLEMLERGPADWGVDTYRDVCQTIGLDVTWQPDGSGRCVGVDDEGALLVETPAGLERLSAGEVREVRPSR